MATHKEITGIQIGQNPVPVLPSSSNVDVVYSSDVSVGDSFILSLRRLEEDLSSEESIIQESKQLIFDELKKTENFSIQQQHTQEQEFSRSLSYASSSSTEFTSAEFQTKVEELIEENKNLKDTLVQTNKSMKNYNEKILAWHHDVEKIHKAQKEKFQENQQFVDVMKKEIAHLKNGNKQLEDEIGNTHQLQNLKLSNAKIKIIDLKQVIEEMEMNSDWEAVKNTTKLIELDEKLERYERYETELRGVASVDQLAHQFLDQLGKIKDDRAKLYLRRIVNDHEIEEPKNPRLLEQARNMVEKPEVWRKPTLPGNNMESKVEEKAATEVFDTLNLVNDMVANVLEKRERDKRRWLAEASGTGHETNQNIPSSSGSSR